MKQLYAVIVILSVVVFAAPGCAEGELQGPGTGADASVRPDSSAGGFPDAAAPRPDARPFPDARVFPDAGTATSADGGLLCTVDSDCGTNGCCTIAICLPLPGPCQP